MSTARLRAAAVVAWVVSLLLTTAAARADKGDPPEVEAHRLVHILGYIGGDYPRSIQEGKILDYDEYEEQLELAEEADRLAARLEIAAPAGAGPVDLIGPVGKVRALVENKAPPAEVTAATAAASERTAAAFRLEQAPSTPPDRERARALYTEHCATCHGETGRADTARAATLEPRPASFHDPDVADGMTPFRVATTVRFGVPGTAMVPFTFLSDAQRWDLAFHVLGLRHTAAPSAESPTYSLGELAILSDVALREDLRAAGVAEDEHAAILADLRGRAPYEDRAGRTPLLLARDKLLRARVALSRGERRAARGHVIDAYLEGIEPVEPVLAQADAALAGRIEEGFRGLRAGLESPARGEEMQRAMDGVLADITRAERVLSPQGERRSALSTALASAAILLREGVEAALLLGALLGLAAQAGLHEKKRFVHLGWVTAVVLGVLTWIASRRLVAISGAQRELIEGVTALLAMAVLFYVSYGLLARREVARWMRFLRERVSPRRAALSLFGVSLLACYREAFETVLFYQALLAGDASPGAALAGAGAGAAGLGALVVAYGRAGKLSPPQVFFRVSGYVLYLLAVVFAGQGVAALQVVGIVPVHPVRGPTVGLLGIHPTVETLGAQLVLIALAAYAWLASRRDAAGEKPAAGSRFRRRIVYMAAGLLAIAAVVLVLRSPGETTMPARPAGSTFTMTLRVRGPGPVKSGIARLYGAGFDRTVRFGPGDDAVFTDVPVSLRETGAKVSMSTEPEYEATWEPDRVFPLHRDVLELRMKLEKPNYEVVLLDKPDGGAVRALRLPGFNLGHDEVDIATFTSRAVTGLRVLHPDVPAPSRLTALSVARKRWLRPVTSVEHLEFDETVIVLVDQDVRAEMGEEPAAYLDVAAAALGKKP